MMRVSPRIAALAIATTGLLGLTLAAASPASAATVIDGPVGLGTAADFVVLGGSTVTDAGASVIDGDVGLSPGTSITGFPPATTTGTIHQTDAEAAQAQVDLTTAYNTAASLTPMASGLGDLTGASLVPGVYAGGELGLSGELILEGTAESVWVFQAASTLTVGTGALITLTGGASACNVFWQVSSSATIGSGAQFAGTVMASESITAETAATVTGRLLARTGAVALDSNVIDTPLGCTTEAGTVSTSATITSSAPPSGQAGTAYSYTATASGTPTATFSITSGALPPGLTLDATTGVISGVPTASGVYTFTITASNGTPPDSAASYSITIAAPAVVGEAAVDDGLADSGADIGGGLLIGAIGVTLGAAFVFWGRHRGFSRIRTSREHDHG
ncbi:ice-binding family protein [Planococcus sp. APC 4015]|nr:ice-binding family protein [Planococcus sp. APC 4015]